MHNQFFKIFICVCLVGTCLAKALAEPPSRPTRVRLVDFFSPLGIDNAHPRFGWQVNDSDRNEKQTAYEIEVADNLKGLTQNEGLVWKSGKIDSPNQFGVEYNGKPLKNTSEYWWRVRTWDKDGNISPWSIPSSFVTSFIDGQLPAEAKWIQHPEALSKQINPLPVFRKTFTISKSIKHAWLYITGLGQFEAFVNGKKIGDHVTDPAWTDYDKTICYLTFDVTKQLVNGRNILSSILAPGWYVHKGMRDFGTMKLIAQLHIQYQDGSVFNIITDSSWKACISPYLSVEVHGSEDLDGTSESMNWSSKNAIDEQWKNVSIATSPIGILRSQFSPPIKVHKNLNPIAIKNMEDGSIRYDFGQNINGQFEALVKGRHGDVIIFKPGEYIDGKGEVIASPNTTGIRYKLQGNGVEKIRLSFSSIGFRYVKVYQEQSVADKIRSFDVKSIKAFFTYSASEDVGTFSTSDSRYNQIYQLALNTLHSNIVSIHTDGPMYEKLGWQEVVWTLFPSFVYNNDIYNLYSKIAGDIFDSQRLSGQSPSIAPNYWLKENAKPTNEFDDAPAWGSSLINLPWQIYQFYGDSRILRFAYPKMKAYLGYLKSKETKSETVEYGLGDWMAPAGSFIPNVEGAIYVHDTKILLEAAKILQNNEDTLFYNSEYARVLNAYNKKFLNTDSSFYNPLSQANEAIPLAFDMVLPENVKDVRKALLTDIGNPTIKNPVGSYGQPGEFGPILPFHVTTGDIGTTFLWRSLGDMNQSDLVQKMIMQIDEPSYLAMINKGFTTIPENWNLARARSYNHDMYAGIMEWFFRSVGGISQIEPGFKKIKIKPAFPTGLQWAATTYNSINGLIQTKWRKEAQLLHVQVSIPVNTTAEIHLPWNNFQVITEGGRPLKAVAGIQAMSLQGNYIEIDVGSGSYDFLIRMH